MRFPSLSAVASDARATFGRFPLALLSSLAAGVATGLHVGHVGSASVLTRIGFVGSLGIPLFIALRSFEERGATRGPRHVTALGLPLLGILALVVLYAAWDDWLEPVALRRYVQLSVCSHLLVAFAPWLGRGTLNGFWQYNRVLFVRFCIAALFSGVLYAGISVALLALDQLFALDVRDEHYTWLWLAVAFAFNTWYFLGGVPRDYNALDVETRFSKALRIFSQYILVPIVALYLAILTAYIVKILSTRAWPSGWIGYLVCSVSALGILSLLLVHPIRERREHVWIRTYARSFYAALLPSIAMLCVAIWKRVNQYGVTENRYFLTVIALWLAGIAVFFLLRQSRNIRVIPVSLCLVALGTSFGPWGAYSVSHRSQTGRLEELLTRNHLLQDGRLRRIDHDVPFDDRRQMSAALTYLLETHGHQQLVAWFGSEAAYAEADTLHEAAPASRAQAWQRVELIMLALGVPYVHDRGASVRFNLHQDGQRALRISGYDFVLPQLTGRGEPFTRRFQVGDDSLQVHIDPHGYRARISRVTGSPQLGAGSAPSDEVPSVDREELWIEFGIEALRDAILRHGAHGFSPTNPVEPIRIGWSNQATSVLLDVRSVTGRLEGDQPHIDYLQVDLYMTAPTNMPAPADTTAPTEK